MRLLLDMGLSPRTARFLREHGHDALHLWEQGLQRLADPEIVQKARHEERVIVTFDLDFPRILALERRGGPSVVLFRLQEFTTDGLNESLLQILDLYARMLEEGALVVVEEDRVRTRRLPIWP